MIVLKRTLHCVVSLGGMLLIALFTGNQYRWMQEMDTSLETLPVDNNMPVKLALATCVLLLVVGLNGYRFAIGGNHSDRVVAGGLIVLVLVTYFYDVVLYLL
uniref:hypothetical protein n=1 Tax=Thaumasiovibrio occultus TaxID=1891184 RepID=UPI000B358422|nr:hypothetical protein [Thaumasiovibrio occultus]